MVSPDSKKGTGAASRTPRELLSLKGLRLGARGAEGTGGDWRWDAL